MGLKIIYEIEEWTPLHVILNQIRKTYLEHHLGITKGNFSKVAELLDIGRTTIYRSLKNSHTHSYRQKEYSHQCSLCGKPATLLHHVLPKNNGGKDCMKNREFLCSSCHKKLHSRFLKPLQMKIIELKNHFDFSDPKEENGLV